MAGQEQIDTRALELATAALTRIDAHEKACDARMDEIRDGQHRIESSIAAAAGRVDGRIAELWGGIDKLHDRVTKTTQAQLSRWLGAAAALIAVLLGVCGWLAVRVLDFG